MTPARLALPLCLLAAATAAAEPTPFVHVQTDKPSYRLGETVWFRLHGERVPGLRVRLLGPQGTELAAVRPKAKASPVETAFLLDPEWPGGPFTLVAEDAEGLRLHQQAVEVFDVAPPALLLSLRVLADSHLPGDTVTAAFEARDPRGRPLAGEQVKFRATFGREVVIGFAGPTDSEGRTVIRCAVPEGARTSGHLSAGLAIKSGAAAIAAPVALAAPVGAVDVFPEGGAVLPGKQRLGLLVRDERGRPVACEGRVFDDRGECAATFVADARGQAAVTVEYAEGRRYALQIDRPAGTARRFPLPALTAHPLALRLERTEKGLAVHLRARDSGTAQVHLVHPDGRVERDTVRTSAGEERAARFGRSGSYLEIAHVVVTRDERAYLRVPVLLGERPPLEVALMGVEGEPLPGREVTLHLQATLRGQPVQADLGAALFASGALGGADAWSADLAARALLQPHAIDPVQGLVDLFASDPDAPARRDAFLLVRGAYAYPPEGLPLAAGALPDAEVGRAPLTGITPPPASADEPPQTEARPTDLDRLLARAPFTRADLPRAAGPNRARRIASPEARLATPGLGKRARKLPQQVRLRRGQVDTRDTVAWAPRLKADARGVASLTLRLPHDPGPLRLAVQGMGAGPAGLAVGGGAAAQVVVARHFHTQVDVPTHLHAGDLVELYAEVAGASVTGKAPLLLEVQAPEALEPLDRTRVEVDPRVDARKHKFRFRARHAAAHARLTVLTRGAAFYEVQEHDLVIRPPAVEVSQGVAAFEAAGREVSFSIPSGALPGSVRTRTRVARSPLVSAATEGVSSLLRQPYGCFEQTTSTNYPNLVVLSCLRERGADAAVLARAHALAQAGYERVLTFQHASGGFGLYPGEEPTAAYTAMGVVQLAHYGRLFQGRGTVAMQRALAWLDAHTVGGTVGGLEAAFAALATQEAGVPWKGALRALQVEPKTAYERAVLANAVAAWRTPWPKELPPRQAHLAALVAPLLAARDPDSGLIASKGRGLMASWQHQLDVETTALAAVAFDAGGHGHAALQALEALLRQRTAEGAWPGTQSTAQAVRALARLAPAAPAPEPLTVARAAGGRRPVETLLEAGRDRPVTLERPLSDVGPGQTVSVRLGFAGAAEKVDYQLACAYLIARPQTSPAAPFAVTTQLQPAQVNAGESTTLIVTLSPRGLPAQGQVVAAVPLPGGVVLDREALASGGLAGATHTAVKDGVLELYWERPPARAVTARVPLKARVVGHFRTAPASAFPYYASGQEAFAPGLELKVLPAFDTMGAAGLLGR